MRKMAQAPNAQQQDNGLYISMLMTVVHYRKNFCRSYIFLPAVVEMPFLRSPS